MYNRAIDIDGLRRFHHHLQQGRLSRRIERSPLPFGRHRWVSPSDQSDLEIVATPRPREEFDAWLSEQANTPLDAEHGPGWHLAVLPFTDGGAGVSFVTSHCLIDGVGLCEALADAASGRHDPISWPAAGSRRRWQALREDARQTARDIPAIGRAVVAAARFARRNRGGDGSATQLPTAPRSPFVGPDERVAPPMATIFVDADEWDARAHSLGGTSNTLLAGLAARLAQRAGRVTADGFVTLALPVNERAAGDTRANAITAVDITVDPAAATTDLREIRAAIKQALIRRQEVPDERWALLPLVSAAAAVADQANGRRGPRRRDDQRIIQPRCAQPGRQPARRHRRRLLRHEDALPGGDQGDDAPHRRTAGVALGNECTDRSSSRSLAYQPGRPNSNDDLRRDLSSALSDFSLTATTGWGCPAPVGAAR